MVQLDFYPETPVRLVKTDLPYYQIPTLPSPTQQLLASVDNAAKDLPALVRKGITTLDLIQKIVSPENAKAVSDILASGAATMRTLQADAASIGPVIGRADSTLVGANRLIGHLDDIAEENRADIRASLHNFRQASASIDRLADQLNGVIAEDRVPIRQFTEATLPDLSGLIIDARTAVDKTTTILDSFERNPSRFIFSNKTAEGVQLR